MISAQTILNELPNAASFSELCRLCGKMKSPAIPIFDESHCIIYHELINFHIKNIQVSKTDVLPLKLCVDCAQFVVSWHRFHNTCLQVNVALSSAYDKLQNKFIGLESNSFFSKNDVEVIEVDVESVGNISPLKLPETNVECLPEPVVLVDTNATSTKKVPTATTAVAIKLLPIPLSANTATTTIAAKPSPMPLSANTTATNVVAKPSRMPLSANTAAINVVAKPSPMPLSANGGFGGTTRCIICGSMFLKSKVQSAENRGTCYACFSKMQKSTTPNIPSVFKNYLVTDENKQSYFVCDLCDFSCDALPDVFSYHYKTKHPEANLHQNFAKLKYDPLSKYAHEKNGVRSYRCDRCPISCISRNLFVKHYADQHGDQTLQTLFVNSSIQYEDKQFRCGICPKTFTQPGAASRHFNRVHGEKKYQCKVCQKAFMYEHRAKEHEKRHLKIKFFMCDICGKRFVEKANMEKHMQKKICCKYSCSSCNQTFADKDSLRKHLEYWEKFKKPVLANCPSAEKNRDSILQKESLLKFECAKCKKKFKSKIALRIHIVEEFNLKPYKCFVCDQQFTTTALLKKHMISCNKSIILDANQCDDMSMMKGDGSFGCKLCGRTFRRIGYLRQHFRLHSTTSASKPYVCQFCGKTYAQKASFDSHLLTEMNLRK